MDKNKICEAMYALPAGVVVKRRKSLFIPLVILLLGVGMLVGNSYLTSMSNNLRSAVVFVGGLLAVAGAVMVAVRLLGAKGAPYHRPKKEFLCYEELYFDRKFWREIVQCVDNGEVARLEKMEHAAVPAVTVALYRTEDKSFAAMQAFEYADLEYRPLSNLKIVGA